MKKTAFDIEDIVIEGKDLSTFEWDYIVVDIESKDVYIDGPFELDKLKYLVEVLEILFDDSIKKEVK